MDIPRLHTSDLDTMTVSESAGETQGLGGPGERPAVARRIGAYQILRELGHGGMGTVFLAARADDQYQKRVAIKVVRGTDSAEVIRLFRRERQILAGLEHPNIARLLDGGTTEDGLPFFVLEYVEGEPIDRYCDAHALSTHERLRLFQGVCAAVQHAHRNLAVHRDLKPSNIMVTAEGTPKLLDFGIAKLVSPGASGEGSTATGLAMTPAYASPEQARGGLVTTATDVYSLGVILYELLTGHRPYRLKSYEPLEVLRAVSEEVPEKPSTAVRRTEFTVLPDGTTGEATAASVSRTREGTPARLRRRLQGDLDTIVMMALRKEPDRRYGSVEAFSEDVRRYLEGLPVAARRGSVGYQAGKFVRRHMVGVSAAAALLLLVVSFGVAMAAQSRRTARERDKAERLAGFMVDIFQVSDPSEARGNTVTAREVLDAGVEKISKQLEAEPETRATLLAAMGRVYRSLGLYERAKQLLTEALRLRRDVLRRQDPELAKSLHGVAVLLYDMGDYAGAESLYREALELQKKLLGPEHQEVASTLSALATVLYSTGDYAGAESLHRETLALRRKLLGDQHADVSESLTNLAAVLTAKGRYDEAEPLFRKALEIDQRLFGDNHPSVATDINNVAAILEEKGDHAAAEPLYREALAIRRKVLGNQHPAVATTLNNLAVLRAAIGDPRGAEPLYREALEIDRRTLGPEHPDVASDLASLGNLLRDDGNLAAAEPLLRQALAMRRKLLGEDHPDVGESLEALAALFSRKGDPVGAEPLFRQALAVRQRALGDEHPAVAASLLGLAEFLATTGRPTEAEALARKAVALARQPTVRLPERARAEGILGLCLLKLHRLEEAEPLLLAGYAPLDAQPRPSRVRRDALERLVALYDARGDAEQAAAYRARF
jgi:serine/threonine protein kinase/tetratricopeptide (TPR) repeat protein